MNNFSLKDKVAVITGGASGIGNASAYAFSDKGAIPVLLDIKDEVDLEAKKINSKSIGLKVDITSKQSLIRAKDQIIKKYGHVDIVMNCAGIGLIDKAENLSEDFWNKTIKLNLTGTFLTSQVFGKEMIKQGNGGKIINMASQAGIVALYKHVAYASSKGGVIMMTEVMAYEWAKYNIQVNAISPEVILTELGKKAWAGKAGDDFKRKIPAHRFGKPEEVGSVAVFLAAPETNLITGTNIVIDGGYTIQ